MIFQKDTVKDAWLDNIDWADINSFKKLKPEEQDKVEKSKAKTSADDGEENEADGDESESSDEDEDKESTFSNEEESSQVDVFKKIVEYLKPGETVLRAIKRLGNSSKSAPGASGSASSLSASQRWLKKKTPPAQDSGKQTPDSAGAAADKLALEKLTGYANHFIDRGFYDIYDETYEKLRYKVKEHEEKAAKKEANSFDLFGEELDEANLTNADDEPAKTSSGAAATTDLIKGKSNHLF